MFPLEKKKRERLCIPWEAVRDSAHSLQYKPSTYALDELRDGNILSLQSVWVLLITLPNAEEGVLGPLPPDLLTAIKKTHNGD